MQFPKKPLALDEQVDLLLARGMHGDRLHIRAHLETVSYYRLSGYLVTWKEPDDSLRGGVDFDEVWDRYVFDRELRLLVMDAIERIEVAVRTMIVNNHALRWQDPFAYATNRGSLPRMKEEDWNDLMTELREEVGRSKDASILHFREKYGDCHADPPIWVVAELMSFGKVGKFYSGCEPDVTTPIAEYFGVTRKVFGSWIHSLSHVRNLCAHHARLWNRELGVRPSIPHKGTDPRWHEPVLVEPFRIFSVLTICHVCLAKIAPDNHWKSRLEALLAKHDRIPIEAMGVPANWVDSLLWAISGAV